MPNVIFVDELIDSGSTLKTLLALIPHAETCCCLSKGKPTEYVGCDFIPNAWLIGFGLDDNGEKRGFVHLMVKNMDPAERLQWRERFGAWMQQLGE